MLRHFAQANSVDDEDLGALEDEDGDFEAHLEDLDEVDDEEFERLLALAEEEEGTSTSTARRPVGACVLYLLKRRPSRVERRP